MDPHYRTLLNLGPATLHTYAFRGESQLAEGRLDYDLRITPEKDVYRVHLDLHPKKIPALSGSCDPAWVDEQLQRSIHHYLTHTAHAISVAARSCKLSVKPAWTTPNSLTYGTSVTNETSLSYSVIEPQIACFLGYLGRKLPQLDEISTLVLATPKR